MFMSGSIQRKSSLIAWDLVDVGLVNSVLNLHDKQMNFSTKLILQKNCNQSCLSKVIFQAN